MDNQEKKYACTYLVLVRKEIQCIKRKITFKITQMFKRSYIQLEKLSIWHAYLGNHLF